MVAAAERGHGVGGGAARSGRAISVRVDVFMSCISSLIARKSFSVVARTIEQGGGMNEFASVTALAVYTGHTDGHTDAIGTSDVRWLSAQ